MKIAWAESGMWLWVAVLWAGVGRMAWMGVTGRVLSALGLVFGLFVLYFFRDPNRVIPRQEGAVVSPADGRVMVITEEFEPTFLKATAKRISIFLSIFDVHVQRAPIAGSVEWIQHTPGKFLTAWKPEASVENERQAIAISSASHKVLVHQIAGLIARRIVGWVKPGDPVALGDRIGMIKFGSRVDVFLPASADVAVKVGDRVKGGSDVIARVQA